MFSLASNVAFGSTHPNTVVVCTAVIFRFQGIPPWGHFSKDRLRKYKPRYSKLNSSLRLLFQQPFSSGLKQV